DLKGMKIKTAIGIMKHQQKNILMNCLEFLKTKLYGVEITLNYLQINVLLFGIKGNLKEYLLPWLSMLGLHLIKWHKYLSTEHTDRSKDSTRHKNPSPFTIGY